jgi:putative ATP-dependent endonuclease of OLD family
LKIRAFAVQGFRCLADIDSIPFGAPTILTGANDGGKTSVLRMLEFLLGGALPLPADYTRLALEPPMDVCMASGHFDLSNADREALGFDATVEQLQLRRLADRSTGARYEMLMRMPENPLLRGLSEALTVEELRNRASVLGLSCTGHQRRKDTFLPVLLEAAENSPTVETWEVVQDRAIREILPRYVSFSSTREPDPLADIRQALQAQYDILVSDEERLGPVRNLERQLQEDLAAAASQLSTHIHARCPELSKVDIEPYVSFSRGLLSIQLFTGDDNVSGVALDSSGSGRKRRITLAVWEWTQQLLSSDASGQRSIVIGYDEPDTHLDYQHQRQLVSLIRDQAATPGLQILVATHALNLIDRVDIGDVIHLSVNDRGQTVVNRLVDDDHEAIDDYLRDLAGAMGLKNSTLLHERGFVVVEGLTEQHAIPRLFRLVTGLTLQAAGLALIVGDNNDGALKLVRSLVQHHRPLWVLVDRDTFLHPSTRSAWSRDKLARFGLSDDRVFALGDPNELEDLFSNDQWATCANAHWPLNSEDSWTTEDIAELRVDGKFSERLFARICAGSSEAPGSKAYLVPTLATTLGSANEVPAHLARALSEIAEAVA